jgi:hypothetical protein
MPNHESQNIKGTLENALNSNYNDVNSVKYLKEKGGRVYAEKRNEQTF